MADSIGRQLRIVLLVTAMAGLPCVISAATTTVTEFVIPTSYSVPWRITAGPDGNLWFTEQNGNKIGQITPAGVISEFPIPTAGSSPGEITAGPDGNLWFTEFGGNKIGRISPAGAISEFTIPTANSSPLGITAGPDGNVWFKSGAYGAAAAANVVTSTLFEQYPPVYQDVTNRDWYGDGVIGCESLQPTRLHRPNSTGY